MPRINITNFEDIPTEMPKAALGWHKCEIVQGVEALSKKAKEAGEEDDNMINWQFKILEGESEGQMLFLTSMTRGDKPNSAFMTRKIFVMADVVGDDSGFELDDAKGCQCEVKVVAQPYQGEVQHKAKDVRKVQG